MKKSFTLFSIFVLASLLNFSIADFNGVNKFYRLQNVSTNRYIDVIHNTGSFDPTSSSTEDYHAVYMIGQQNDPQVNYLTEPGSILYITGSQTNADLNASGIKLSDIVGVTIKIKEYGTVNNQKVYNAVVNKGFLWYSEIALVQDENGFDKGGASDISVMGYTVTNTSSSPVSQWYIKPINDTDNFFCIIPEESNNITIDGTKYYFTTLRTDFAYVLSNNVKAFIVNYNNELVEIATTGDRIVPKNTPVILRTPSLIPADNILTPTTSTGTAVSGNKLIAATSYFKTFKPNAKLLKGNYNGSTFYGFGDSFSTSNANYKVLSVKDGKLGFFDLFTDARPSELCINGELAYMNTTDDIILLADEADLKTIANEGSEGHTYQVDHNLYGVTVVDGKLYAKDNNNYANKSIIENGQVDYMQRAGMQAYNSYDQSNWVALNVTNPESYINKDLTVMGTLLRKPNPEMNVEKITATGPQQSGYTPNVYIPASFMGKTQTSTVGNQETFFFVTPKPQEYAHITWAVYGGDGKFYIAAPQGSVNQGQLIGGFEVNDAFMPSDYSISSFTEGNTYEFDAIIQRSTASKATPYTEGGLSDDWVVYPLTAPTVITAVNDVNVTKTVAGIKYYNLAGMASDVPFDGINIRVTTYSDGTRQASKIRF